MEKQIAHFDTSNFTLAIPELDRIMGPELAKKAHERAEKEILRLKLKEFRKNHKKTQADVTAFKQSSVSKIERRNDFKLSTLVEYMQSLDMGLEITAIPKDGSRREVILHVE
ncbi:MAG: XRE family transcriptional regulator [Spirochaetaceae bacterium]|jgi:hypothetical protein|nr:XRE family transcriptional regulator [Spirochaetaceae bacterium]